jgi:hypothetical protein
MSAYLMPQGKQQYFASTGLPLVGGKVYTYAAGTTTPLATYTDAGGLSVNSNPVILDSRGEASIFFSAATYKIALQDSTGAAIWTADNLVFNPFSAPPPIGSSTPNSIAGTTGTFSGAVSGTTGTFSSTVAGTSGNFSVGVTGVTGIFSGAVTGTTGTFSGAVSGTTGTFSGAVAGTTGTFSGSVTLPSVNGGPLGLRNKITNGAILIDQRNAGAAQTITAAAALAYTVDRWYAYCTGANVTGQQVAGTAPNAYLYRFTGAASTTKIGFSQRIEALNVQDLCGKTATLGVDLSNNLLATVTWTAWYANTANTFGTLAAPTRTQIATGTFTVTSTLARYSANIAIPAGASAGVEIEFSVGSQISGTWSIGNAQLETGAVATPFEARPIGMELTLCQRYYESVSPLFLSQNTSVFTSFFIPYVAKRVIPTIVTSGSWPGINSQVVGNNVYSGLFSTGAANTSVGVLTATAEL